MGYREVIVPGHNDLERVRGVGRGHEAEKSKAHCELHSEHGGHWHKILTNRGVVTSAEKKLNKMCQ
jgi:hypothetical protein